MCFGHNSAHNAPFYDLIDDSGIPRRDLSFPDVKTHLGATYKLKNSLKIICSIIFILNQHAPNQPVKSYTPLMYMYIDMRIHIYIYIYIVGPSHHQPPPVGHVALGHEALGHKPWP